MQKWQNQHATRCLKTGTKCYTPTLKTQATYLDAKGAYAVCQMCTKTLKFTMYITHVVSVCTFIHATPVLKFCTGSAYNQYIYRYVSCSVLRFSCTSWIMWLYNALKLKKSPTVFSAFWWLFEVSCGVLRFSVIPAVQRSWTRRSPALICSVTVSVIMKFYSAILWSVSVTLNALLFFKTILLSSWHWPTVDAYTLLSSCSK